MKIALIGYGKMGRMIEEIAVARGHEIVSIIDVDNRDDFDSEAFCSADVAIEFTAPQAAYDNYMRAFAHHVKVVSGSTGWIPQHGEEVKRMCEKEGQTLFWSSNFSLGVTIFRAVNRYLARIMNQFDDYTPSMEEVHHVHKLDHPSGTAITLAEELAAEVERVGLATGHAHQPQRLTGGHRGGCTGQDAHRQHTTRRGARHTQHHLGQPRRQHHHHPRCT